jgi:elongation factor Ts
MAEITAAAVQALRARTNMPMMKCKKALMEAGGDEEAAVQILQKESKEILGKRAENATAEGRIFLSVKDDGSEGGMVEVQCESAPVAGGEDFTRFGNMLVQQLMEGPGAGSPQELLAQPAPGAGGKTLQDIFDDMVGTIREKIVVARIARVDGPVAGYVHHDGKTAVLMQAAGENATDPVLRDVAMHVAALRPAVVSPEELPAEQVQAEKDKLSAEAKASGKPDNIIEKIVDGQLKRYYGENGVLMFQGFAKDDKKTVSQAMSEKGLKPVAFTRWMLGN